MEGWGGREKERWWRFALSAERDRERENSRYLVSRRVITLEGPRARGKRGPEMTEGTEEGDEGRQRVQDAGGREGGGGGGEIREV